VKLKRLFKFIIHPLQNERGQFGPAEAAIAAGPILEGLASLFGEDEGKASAKIAARVAVMQEFLRLLESEAQRRQENIQGVKDAERKAPIKAALIESIFSGGLPGGPKGGFSSPTEGIGGLTALRRTRTFQGETPGTVSLAPGGEAASPESLAQLATHLDAKKYHDLMDAGRQAASQFTPENLFTPKEGVAGEIGNFTALDTGVARLTSKDPAKAAEEQRRLDELGGLGV